MLDSVISFLNQGWVGALIGALGISFALYQIFRRSDAKPVFQYSGQKLISSSGGLLPNEVSVRFNGEIVPRISLTYLAFWNHGQATIRGIDIADSHPLTFSFKTGQILKIEVVKVTRGAIEASAYISADDPSRLHTKFSFLDANDGFMLKILHTADETKPVFEGTIMGVPQGVKFFGAIMFYQFRKGQSFIENLVLPLFSPSWLSVISFTLTGVLCATAAIYPEFVTQPLRELDIESNIIRLLMGFGGAVYLGFGAYIWARLRRRFPSSLNPE
jgi:hypothetical protein